MFPETTPMEADPLSRPPQAHVTVEPGICGFCCEIKAWKLDSRTVFLEIAGSECKQGQVLAGLIKKITLNELFTPVTRNPVFLAAEKARCHVSCPVPVAVLKAAEVAMEMALPRDVCIRFQRGIP